MEENVNNNETAAVSNKPLKTKRLTPATTVLMAVLFAGIVLLVGTFIVNIVS